MRTFHLLLVASTAGFFLAGTGGAQIDRPAIDEGIFTISMAGQPAGTETFSIRRSEPGEPVRIIAQGQIRIRTSTERTEAAPALQLTGADMALSAYQLKVSGDRTEEIYVTLGERRFLTRTVSDSGEREREYPAHSGTLLLDRGVAHHYFVVGARFDEGITSFPVLIPSEGRQLRMEATRVGGESIRIGGELVQARHIRLEGGGERRDIWLDGHHVLRVEDPGSGYHAERQRLPR